MILIYSIAFYCFSPSPTGTAGVLATIPEVMAISPFENIKLAEQLDKEKKFSGMPSVVSHLLKTRGVGGLYIGYIGMQFRQGLWTGGFFASLDVFKGFSNGIFGRRRRLLRRVIIASHY